MSATLKLKLANKTRHRLIIGNPLSGCSSVRNIKQPLYICRCTLD